MVEVLMTAGYVRPNDRISIPGKGYFTVKSRNTGVDSTGNPVVNLTFEGTTVKQTFGRQELITWVDEGE